MQDLVDDAIQFKQIFLCQIIFSNDQFDGESCIGRLAVGNTNMPHHIGMDGEKFRMRPRAKQAADN